MQNRPNEVKIKNWRDIKQISKLKSDSLVINITNRDEGIFSDRLVKQNSDFLKKNRSGYWYVGVKNNYDYVVLIFWRSRSGLEGKDIYVGEAIKANGRPKLISGGDKYIIQVRSWMHIGKTTSSVGEFCAPNSISSGSATHFLRWQIGSALADTATKQYKKLIAPDTNFKKIDPGEREAMRKYRLNQDKLRDLTLKNFNGQCCLSRIDVKEILVCSHIKPWAVSEEDEKCDLDNTLMLAAIWDRLFDRGFISFADSGKIKVSKKLTISNCQKIGIQREFALDKKFLTDGRKKYLKYHREYIFKN